MKPVPTEASLWRVAMAREIAAVYSRHPNVKMILIGGSPARGISDQYSDIDMIVYWDQIDAPFIASKPLLAVGGDFRFFLPFDQSGSGMELYYFDTLIYECGHISLAAWDELVQTVHDRLEPNPHLLKSLEGFTDALPLYGAELYRSLRDSLPPYPDELARKIIKNNLGFFWPGCLLHQGLHRNEILYFYDGLCATCKRLLTIVAALNKVYFSALEPRWTAYELARMPIKPDNMGEKIAAMFEGDRTQAITIMEQLITDTVALVAQHHPEISLDGYYTFSQVPIMATASKPEIKSP